MIPRNNFICCRLASITIKWHTQLSHCIKFFHKKSWVVLRHVFSSVRLKIYLSNCVVYYRFLWLGRESSWLTCLPHYPTRCHAHMSLLIRISLPSLSGLYCTNSRTTEIPNGPTPLYSPNNRGSSETSAVYPIQYHDLAVFANPCQLLFCETHARNNPGVHVIFDGFPFRQFTSLRKRRRNSYPHVSGGRTLWVMPVFTTYLSALNA